MTIASFSIGDVPDLIASWRKSNSPRLAHLADQLQTMFDNDAITLGDAPPYRPPVTRGRGKAKTKA